MKTKTHDLTGKKFGLLTAIKPIIIPGKNYRKWLCLCDCGTYKEVRTSYLLSNEPGKRTRSCGCNKSKFLSDLNSLEYGLSSKNVLIKNYKRRAEKKNLKFELDNEQLDSLFLGNCFYCGTAPSNELKGGKSCIGTYTYNGIDRLDSGKGYIKGNVVSCCKFCNQAKNDRTVNEFLAWITKVFKFQSKKGRPRK